MATNTILVSNSSELSAALKSATGGETILLESGNYGDFSGSGLNFNSNVTIQSADPEDAAEFRSINLSNVSHLTFDGVDVNLTIDSNTTSWTSAVRVNNSSDVTFKNSTLQGEVATSGDGGASGIVAGYPVGRAFTISKSSDVTIENNDISVFHKGIIPSSVDGLNIVHNEIYDLRTSPVTGSDVRDVNIEGNYFHSSQPWAYGGSGDHGDYVHLWIKNGQTEPSDNINIEGNYFAEGTGQSMLGVYIDNNGHMDTVQFENVDIKDNVFATGNHQGIRVEGAQDLEITNNTLVQVSGDSKDGPTIVLAYGVEDAVVANNIISMPLVDGAGSQYNTNISEYGNLLVQAFDPNGENYIGDLFVNGTQDVPSLSDLLAVSGGLLEHLGVGSSLTFDSSAAVGNYDAGSDPVVTVPDDNGGSDPVVTNPDDNGGSDPVVTNPDDNGGSDPVVTNPDDNGGLSDALQSAMLDRSADNIGDGIINLGKDADYFNLDDMTVSLTFRQDDLDSTDRERALWNHGKFGIQMVGDDLHIYFGEDGEKADVYQFKDIIPDTDWHDVQLVLDDSADSLSIYFDGKVLQTVDDVTKGIGDASWWDVTVGGTTFKNAAEFHGDIADFSIIDHAIDIDASQTVYERTAAIDAYDEHNSSHFDLIGVDMHVQSDFDFS